MLRSYHFHSLYWALKILDSSKVQQKDRTKFDFKYRTSRNFTESKIKHFTLKIEYQILARSNFSDYLL